MLEHQKNILANLSSIKPRFKKELKKSIEWLKPNEMSQLQNWVIRHFGETHQDVISEVFAYA